MSRLAGWALFLLSAWMLASPQSLSGLAQFKWLYAHAFPGEVLLGIPVLAAALHLLDLKPGDIAGNGR